MMCGGEPYSFERDDCAIVVGDIGLLLQIELEFASLAIPVQTIIKAAEKHDSFRFHKPWIFPVLHEPPMSLGVSYKIKSPAFFNLPKENVNTINHRVIPYTFISLIS
jgi:hypothetical protein